jgi:outer membrane protein assembly factor BamB
MKLAHRIFRCLAIQAMAGFVALSAAFAAAPTDRTISTYHGDAARSGNYVVPSLTWQAAKTLHRDKAFSATVQGKIYAQPLYWKQAGSPHGELIVATESDEVDALDAVTGRLIWRAKLGTSVPDSRLPCGDIDPLGITGTPVIDPATGTIYLDAMVLQEGRPQHLVFALQLSNGKILPGWPVNAAQALRTRGIAFNPRVQNQRSALALLDHHVFIAYGGLDGDCGDYHGVVLGLPTRPGHPASAQISAWATRGQKGGIWAPGGISVADGALFFTTGNTWDAQSWSDGEGVFRFGPDLTRTSNPKDFFAPANWKTLDDEDLDMSGVNPLPINLPSGAHRLLALGKDGDAYLLNRDDLGGIGAPLARIRAAATQIITSPAMFLDSSRAIAVYQARRAVCPGGRLNGGIAALAVTATMLKPVWCAPLDGFGAPIVTTTDGHSNPVAWAAGAGGDDRLHAFRGDNGTLLYTSRKEITGLRRFGTMLVADGRLYVAGNARIIAFTWNGQKTAP